MKKGIILLAILLLGCEKERCWECEATCTGYGYTETATQVYCGSYTRAEVRDMASSMTMEYDGIKCEVECREVE